MYLIMSPTSHSQARNPAFGYCIRDEKLKWGLEMRVNNSYSFQNCRVHFREELAAVRLFVYWHNVHEGINSIFLYCTGAYVNITTRKQPLQIS